jgi:hypothetical protein
MPERINGGRALVVLGAVALIVSLFLHWYEPGRTAWTVFEVLDLVLAAIGIAALAAAVPIGRGGAPAGLAVPERWLPVLGVAAVIIVAGALINHPPAARGGSPELGAWIALAAAGTLTVGGILSGARVSLVITLRPREAGTESSDPPPAAPNPGQPDAYDEAADEAYADEYEEPEHIDAEYEEPEPTAEVPLADQEPAPANEDERA